MTFSKKEMKAAILTQVEGIVSDRVIELEAALGAARELQQELSVITVQDDGNEISTEKLNELLALGLTVDSNAHSDKGLEYGLRGLVALAPLPTEYQVLEEAKQRVQRVADRVAKLKPIQPIKG